MAAIRHRVLHIRASSSSYWLASSQSPLVLLSVTPVSGPFPFPPLLTGITNAAHQQGGNKNPARKSHACKGISSLSRIHESAKTSDFRLLWLRLARFRNGSSYRNPSLRREAPEILRRTEGTRGETIADTGIETAEALCDMFRRAFAAAVAGREESKELVAEWEAPREALRAAASFSEALEDSFIRLRW